MRLFGIHENKFPREFLPLRYRVFRIKIRDAFFFEIRAIDAKRKIKTTWPKWAEEGLDLFQIFLGRYKKKRKERVTVYINTLDAPYWYLISRVFNFVI